MSFHISLALCCPQQIRHHRALLESWQLLICWIKPKGECFLGQLQMVQTWNSCLRADSFFQLFHFGITVFFLIIKAIYAQHSTSDSVQCLPLNSTYPFFWGWRFLGGYRQPHLNPFSGSSSDNCFWGKKKSSTIHQFFPSTKEWARH